MATDGSPSAKAAETFAAEMAVAQHATTVAVVTVLREYLARGAVMTPLEAQMQAAELLVDGAARHVRDIMGDETIEIEKKVLVSLSEPEAIIGEAHTGGTCSHIVMGNRGHGEIAELLLGSTSHHVIKDAHCPVTIVRTYPHAN